MKLIKGRPERAQIDLSEFRQPVTGNAPAGSGATLRVPIANASSSKSSLRVVISVPSSGQSRKGVFELGSKSFLIGQKDCHVNLPKASIPARAIRIRAAGEGFLFEGLGGFLVPIESLSIASGQIERGGAVCFKLDPYELHLEPSTTPGRPISDLEGQPRIASPASQPSAQRPAPHSAPAPPPATQAKPSALPRTVAPTAPFGQPPSWPPGSGTAGSRDLRGQLQEVAIDVRPDQAAFDDGDARAVQEALDGDQTITDLGAQGFQAMRFGNPLDGLEVSLVRTDGPAQGQSFKVTKSPLVIGRSGGDMIVHDRRVSSKHAQLDISGPRIYTLKDLASTNGTAVNDRPISVGHLEDGDTISFGGVTFEFRAKIVKR